MIPHNVSTRPAKLSITHNPVGLLGGEMIYPPAGRCVKIDGRSGIGQ